jgi:three-Cys-motif partner protein
MANAKDTLWEIEPHTQAKHEILRRYLGPWYAILSSGFSRVLYIDGFCGPGRYAGGEPGSPIIALQEAIRNGQRLVHTNLIFLFTDERADRIGHLQQELSSINLPGNFTVSAKPGDFEIELTTLLDSPDSQRSEIPPTFAFIDPFGFKGVPYSLVCRLLQRRSTEVFINLAVDSINRFLEHPDPQITNHMVQLFGTTEVLDIASGGGDRIEKLRLLYQDQLAKCARFVRYFQMRGAHDRTVYYLFFASNHPLGHLKMKEAFWQVDPSTGFRFSDATNRNQLVLFAHDETPKLAQTLRTRFAGDTVMVQEIEGFVKDETAFLPSHMRAALRQLEQAGAIIVNSVKADGKKRRANSFPEKVVVTFPPDN